MNINLFDPALTPAPDEFGMFWHPHLTALFPAEMTDWDEASDSAIALGFNVEAEEMDGEFGDIHAWNPKREGWMLAGIGDSDDGPTAYFVKPIATDSAPPLPVTEGVWEALEKVLTLEGSRTMGTMGRGVMDERLFYCEYCEAAHDDFRLIPHQNGCPVVALRAALATRAAPALRVKMVPEDPCEYCENMGLDCSNTTRLTRPMAPPLPESPWKGMESAPKDGRLVELNVIFEEHPLEDDDEAPQQTIGLNNFDNDEVDAWKFAGWCWNDDHFTEGKGKPVGWRPFLRPAAPDSPKGGEE